MRQLSIFVLLYFLFGCAPASNQFGEEKQEEKELMNSTQEQPKFIRSDFTDDIKWGELTDLVNQPVQNIGFRAHVEFVNDSKFKNNNRKQVLKKLGSDYNFNFFFIADKETFENDEFTILCVKIPSENNSEKDSFRVIPSEMCAVENNLSIYNMDFEDFSNSVGLDGVFRGFRR